MSPASSLCPADEVLVQFIEGKATGAASLEVHLDQCPDCTRVLAAYAHAFAEPSLGEVRLLPGAQLGRYRIDALLGAGGMGVVYSAIDPELSRRVALKVLQSAAGAGQVEQARLAREAQALARLNHPNVTAVHDVGTSEGRIYVAMELVDGQTLEAWLRGARRPWAAVLDVFLGAGDGLSAAHAAGLVHRDFKPANVMLGRDHRPRVTDFGLARPVEDEPRESVAPASRASPWPGLTRTGSLLGTPAYMAPEQRQGFPATELSDQYSYCLALYEALVGERAAADRGIGALSVPLPAAVPAWLRAGLRRGLAADPALRFPSMADLLAVLRAGRRRQRNRRLAFAAVALVLLNAVGAWSFRRTLLKEVGICRGAERPPEGVWDATRRRALQQGFAATTAPSADTVAQSIAVAIDRRATALTAMQLEACEASRIRGEQPLAVYELRSACLKRQWQDLNALIAELVHPEPSVVREAMDAVERLEPWERCGDLSALRDTTRPPTAIAAQVAQLGATLSAAKSQVLVGRLALAQSALEGTAARARELGYRPLEAEAQVLLGQVQAEGGHRAEAVRSLRTGAIAAIAGRDDESLLVACRWLAKVTLELEGPDAGMQWLDLSRAALERLSVPAQAAAEQTYLEAQFADRQGDPRRAYQLHQRALGEMERVRGADSPSLMPLLRGLGIQALELGRADEALSSAQRAVQLGGRLWGNEHLLVARARVLEAYALNSLSRNAEAMQSFEIALPVLERDLGANHPEVAEVLEGVASVLFDAQRCDEAVQRSTAALEVRRRALGAGDSLVGVNLLNLGLGLNDCGRSREALAALDEARPILERAFIAQHLAVGLYLFERARASHALGRAAEAISALERARPILEQQSDDAEKLGDLHRLLGLLWWDAGRKPAALELLRRAADEYAKGSAKEEAVNQWLARHGP